MADPIAQYGLSKDAGYLGRLAGIMVQVAAFKLTGDAGDAYAKKVNNDPFGSAARAALFILQSDNFVAKTITVSFGGSGIIATISATDAEMFGQIRDIWTVLTAQFG